jgi:dextranase
MNNQKVVTLFFVLLCGILVLTGCSQTEPPEPDEPDEPSVSEHENGLVDISTDQAAYHPGESVTFQLSLDEEMKKGKLVVRYKHLHDLVDEEEIHVGDKQEITWEWTPSDDDFKGYMVEVSLVNEEEDEIDHLNIAVDVSSDWSKFPRYGYLADFHEMEDEEQRAVIDRLNRFHINGIQFYDWQDRHDHPLKTENGEVASTWNDIANREVSKQTVETYIELAHEKNMKAMNYNLLFGANEFYEEEGVKREWGIFKDPNQQEQDRHPLPEEWRELYLFDPSNIGWQQFIFEKEQVVFDHLAFDGWHVDQLGHRGQIWNSFGEEIELWETYPVFLEKAKHALGVDLVLNAVSQYGQAEIAQSPVNFLYTETWEQPYYEDLKRIIDENWEFSNKVLQTVLAAYMNYDLSHSRGQFNTPGVLFTDAVIFASGGAHIELGENMLANEYFPNKNLEIPDELHEQLINYYDFSVAYQNLLRDGVEQVKKEVYSNDISITSHAEIGSVWNFTKQKENKEFLHFINFTEAASMEWKDKMGEQTEPEWIHDVPITIHSERAAERVWLASPDMDQGSAQELEFVQEGDQVLFTLPALKYWDMVVIEYK